MSPEELRGALQEIDDIVATGRLYTPLEQIGVVLLSHMGYDSGSLHDLLEGSDG